MVNFKNTHLITAMITPMVENGELDLNGLKENILFQKKYGVSHILLLGSTGESSTLSFNEKNSILSLIKDSNFHDLSFIVGAGSNSWNTTLNNIFKAKESGAHAVLIVTPYYNKPNQQGLYEYFYSLAEQSPLPILLYNVPSRTGVDISLSTIHNLSQHPNIIGLKEASDNFCKLIELSYIFKNNDNFLIFTGNDLFLLPALSLGLQGIISVISNLLPQTIKNLIKNIQKEDLLLAQNIYYKIHPLLNLLILDTNPIPIKKALNLCSMPSGNPRLPLTKLSEELSFQIQEELNKQNFPELDSSLVHLTK